CFSMQLSFLISEAGYVPDRLETQAKVYFEDGEIVKIGLNLTGAVPSLGAEEFTTLAQKAKEICPISKLLNTEIELAIEFAGQA
ncbi:MAG: OsmC family protein, partial [Bacteroidota bacterium]